MDRGAKAFYYSITLAYWHGIDNPNIKSTWLVVIEWLLINKEFVPKKNKLLDKSKQYSGFQIFW